MAKWLHNSRPTRSAIHALETKPLLSEKLGKLVMDDYEKFSRKAILPLESAKYTVDYILQSFMESNLNEDGFYTYPLPKIHAVLNRFNEAFTKNRKHLYSAEYSLYNHLKNAHEYIHSTPFRPSSVLGVIHFLRWVNHNFTRTLEEQLNEINETATMYLVEVIRPLLDFIMKNYEKFVDMDNFTT